MRKLLRVASLCAVLCTAVLGQCEVLIAPGLSVPGVNGDVLSATTWDPDGVGPLPEVVVIAGRFLEANGVFAARVAFWEGTGWRWFGQGEGMGVGDVRVVASGANNKLYAGGTFAFASQVAVSRLVQWDGIGWRELGGGVNNAVNDVLVLPNGNVVVCGEFTQAGGAPHRRIAEWDGGTWHSFADGVSLPARSLARLANGNLIVAGDFVTVGDLTVNHIAQWLGNSWQPVGTGTNGPIYSCEVLSNGDLIVGGQFTTAGGIPASNVARWDGVGWSAVGAGVPDDVYSVTPLQAGGVAVTTESLSQGAVHTWNGAAWQQLGIADGGVYACTEDGNGDLFVGGGFALIDGVPCNNVGIWDGNSWLATGNGVDGKVEAIEPLETGGFVAAGTFLYRGGIFAPYLAHYVGGAWSSFGTPDGPVSALLQLGNGDLIVGGAFDHIDGVAFAKIARWDGSSWHALGTGVDGFVRVIKLSAAGDLVVGGGFDLAGGLVSHSIATWDGSAWHAFPVSPGNTLAQTNQIEWLPNGDLITGGTYLLGSFGNPINRIMRWDGVTWHALLPSASNTLNAMTVLDGGELVAAGAFSLPGGAGPNLMRWDGTTWHAIGGPAAGTVSELLVLPDGDFLVAGNMPKGVVRWDGTAWRDPSFFGNSIATMKLDVDSRVIVGGEFTRIFHHSTFLPEPTSGVAVIASACPPLASSVGVACTGSSALLQFSADTLPWIGAAFETTGTGVPATALVATATGFTTTQQPLSLVISQALPACQLLVVPSAVAVQLATTGMVQQQLALPDDVALIGQQFHQQLVAWDLGPQLQINEVISSNALTMTIGAL